METTATAISLTELRALLGTIADRLVSENAEQPEPDYPEPDAYQDGVRALQQALSAALAQWTEQRSV